MASPRTSRTLTATTLRCSSQAPSLRGRGEDPRPTGGVPMMATDVFAAIADPTRRAVLDLLARGPRNAGGIAAEFPRLTQPRVSRHLRVLRKAKLVEAAGPGQPRNHTAKPGG